MKLKKKSTGRPMITKWQIFFQSLAICGLLVVMPVWAEDKYFLSQGCADFLAHRDGKDDFMRMMVNESVTAWFKGFSNASRSFQESLGLKPDMPLLTNNEIIYGIEKFCRENPTKPFSHGVPLLLLDTN